MAKGEGEGGGDESTDLASPNAAALSWAMGHYKFTRYKTKASKGTDGNLATSGSETTAGADNAETEAGDGNPHGKERRLVWPAGVWRERVEALAASTFLVRDLITTPCEDMGPHHLQAVVEAMAAEFGGRSSCVLGEDLLTEGDSYPQIHAVGRAADLGREPRLLDLTWGREDHPKVTLVGKGVCFDTGGLDIKGAANMLTMKKDMGGAAQVLGVARLVMALGLPVRLRVLIPAVENAIAGNAFRPGDVLVARNGKTTEIGNTDAEGRLVLADALVEASSERPDLLIDCATLTGAARVALGTEVPVIFCNDDATATRLVQLGSTANDSVWRLPLWEGYRKQIGSKVADIRNIGTGGYGGAITAALYLDEFVGMGAAKDSDEAGAAADPNEKGSAGLSEEGVMGDAPGTFPGPGKPKWVHMDFMAYNTASKPGRPEGGEAQGMRALFALIEDTFA